MEQITAYNILPQQKTGFSLAKLIIYLLLSLGILISAYLLYRYWLLASGQAVNTDVCSAVFGKGCDSALKNDVSNQLGLPLAAWGLLYYASLLALLVAGRIWRSFQSASPVLLLLLSFLGCLASITLLIMMIIDPQLFCPFCVALHVLNLLLFMSLVKFVNNTQDEFFNQLKQEGKLVFTKRGKEANYKRLALGSVLLLAAMLYSGLYLFSQNAINTSREFDAQKFLAGYNNTSVQEISVGDDDPVLGERNSAVEIIVFSDFQCSGCNYFSAVVREIHKRYPGKVHTVYKYFPLNIACNNT
ncbi:MAG: thioredoxin domain-containing protein, partial [Flavisolibacter sp.]|nr:thioredoxin domain-containing protein [Flavisolibacter sp.]